MSNSITTSTSVRSSYTEPSYSSRDSGYANDYGIVFSSINSPGTISQPVQPISIPFAAIPSQSQILKPLDSSMQSSNVNNYLDFGSNYPPVYPQLSQIKERPVKPQFSDSSSAFTFAPLLAVSMLPTPQQTSNSSIDLINQINQLLPSPQLPKPVNTVPMPKPAVQCGTTKYTDSRVVGGAITQVGEILIFVSISELKAIMHPPKKDKNRIIFEC